MTRPLPQRRTRDNGWLTWVLIVLLVCALYMATVQRNAYEREIRSLQWDLHHESDGSGR